ncbi:MAG: hypothetical protein P4L77_00350 [Sulfuriferula sp.]|nr:hypothetical protein [Sulfuriferula sp.]
MLPHTDCRLGYSQRGAALLVVAVVLTVVALGVLYGRMNVRQHADAVTAQALAEAQAALIFRALSDTNHPGSLPCPDTNNDGVAETTVGVQGGACKGGYIGRLPWRTLGLTDVRDGSGERLWYALSSDARDYQNLKINSQNTAGLLQVNNNANMVAVLFSSGVTIAPQQRGTQAQQLAVGNYLEGGNETAGTTVYVAKTVADPAFDDTVLTLSSADLFRKVERLVLLQIAKNLAPPYPYAAADQSGIDQSGLLAGFVPYTTLPATSASINTLIQNDWFQNNMAASPMLPYYVSAARDQVQINLKYCSGSMHASSAVMAVHCV